MINVSLLLGGMTGGWLDYPANPGMLNLASRIASIPNTVVKKYTWGNWQQAAIDIHRTWHEGEQIVIIGYSGGGSRGTYLCNGVKPVPVALFVAYDPSPAWQMQPIQGNVRQAVNYHNTKPGMWWPGVGALGGGEVWGSAGEITTIDIAENHLLVQFDSALHARTIAAIESLTAVA